MMVAVRVQQNFERHSKITSCLPWICTPLHQPCRRRDRFAVELNEVLCLVKTAFKSAVRLAKLGPGISPHTLRHTANRYDASTREAVSRLIADALLNQSVSPSRASRH